MISASFRVAADLAGNVYLADPLFARIRRINTSGVITTIAGSPTRELGDGGAATAAGLSDPTEVSTDSAGNVYVTDMGNFRVRKVNTAGIISTLAGNGAPSISGEGGPAINARLVEPVGVATDPGGNIYIADKRHYRVRKVSPNGVITTFAGGGTSGFATDGRQAVDALISPVDVAVDASGNVLIADTSINRIWKVTPGGIISTFAGGGQNSWQGETVPATSVQITPFAITVAPNGDVYVLEGTKVGKISGGMLSPVAGTQVTGLGSDGTPAINAALFSPTDVAVDAQGNVYIGEYGMVRKVNSAGLILRVAGDRQDLTYSGDGGPATAARLMAAWDVAVDAGGNLFIGDSGRIRKVDVSGNISTVAFDGTGGVSGDGGHALSAQIWFNPEALAFDGNANLLIADGFGRVRKINFAANGGTVTSMLYKISPSVDFAGANGRNLTVSGGNFTAQSVVRWNGTERATIYRNPQTLEVTIGEADLAQPGGFAVDVSTPGRGVTNSLRFTVVGEPKPAVPVLLSPGNGATGVSLTPTLSWSPSAGATSYRVFFGPDPVLVEIASLNANFIRVGELAPSRQHTWYIVAKNRLWETVSAVRTFVTGDGLTVESGLRFVPVSPCRIADTREGQGTTGAFGPPFLGAGSTRDVPIPSGRCSIPATARAYSLNVTAVPLEPLAYLSLWPTGQQRPTVSTLNSFHGGIVANAAIVPAGTNGSISVFVTNPAQVIVDINGYFELLNGYSFYALDPCRGADTRQGSGFTGPFGSPTPAAQSSRTFPLGGVCGLPRNAGAYSLNVTAVPPGPLSFLTIWPAGQPRPFVSTLNAFDGAVVANAAIVPTGVGGGVDSYVTDRSDAILDVNGYFGAPSGQGATTFFPVTPCRVADTRVAGGGAPIMATGEQRDFRIQGNCGVPADAQAFSLNVTVVPSGPLSYLSLWPTGRGRPLVSTLNSFTGRVVANAALVPAGAGGSVSVFVTNEAHVILDINGYFK